MHTEPNFFSICNCTLYTHMLFITGANNRCIFRTWVFVLGYKACPKQKPLDKQQDPSNVRVKMKNEDLLVGSNLTMLCSIYPVFCCISNRPCQKEYDPTASLKISFPFCHHSERCLNPQLLLLLISTRVKLTNAFS